MTYQHRAARDHQQLDRCAAASIALVLAFCLGGCPLRAAPPATSAGLASSPAQQDSSDTQTRVADCPEEPRASLRLYPPDQAPGEPAPSLEQAVQLHDSGDLDAARGEATALLESLQDHGVDSLSLRFLLGTWALEAEDGVAAEAHFEVVAAAGEGVDLLSEQAQSKLRDARLLAYGVDAVALAEAKDLFEAGDWPGAEEQLKLLFLRGEDGAVLAEAEIFRDEMRRVATEQGAVLLAQVDELLAGPGPYGEAAELLTQVEALPGGTWNAVELRRLRRWYQETSGTEASIGQNIGAADALQSAVLDEARSLVAAMDYRAALARFAELEGSALQETARLEASRARDTLVKEERVRAGRLFVAARKETRPAVRLAALRQVHELLASLLEDFPGSKYAKRVQDNLHSVGKEIATAETLARDADSGP